MKSKILVIGSGGREHALGWSLAQSDAVGEVLYAPGNAGTAREHKGRNVPLDATKKENFSSLADLITSEGVDFTVVGPEAPLDQGVVDYLHSRGITRVFGPNQAASALESDKFWSFTLMQKLGIPQAQSVICHATADAKQAIHHLATDRGVVIKARGLTAGKGVYVCHSKEEGLTRLDEHAHTYGEPVLIAERLFGEEFSVFALSDGTSVSPLEIAIQDHKPLLDGDKGPNTGGMGAYAPASHVAPPEVIRTITRTMLTPLVQHLKERGMPYQGFLYAGMMMTVDGPKVLEFNIRFGDPEAQPAVLLLQGSLYEPLAAALDGKLDSVQLLFKPGAAVCVVMASYGYPGSYKKGVPLFGLHQAGSVLGAQVFHAGTAEKDGSLVTAGGRVLGVTAYSDGGIHHAQTLAYHAVSQITLHEGRLYYRSDIGDKALRR